MTITLDQIESARLNVFSLKFSNENLEKAYKEHDLKRLVLQSRAALLVGILLYALHTVMDFIFIPPHLFYKATFMHFVALATGMTVLATTYHQLFRQYHQIMLFFTAMVGAFGLFFKIFYISAELLELFYPGLLLLIVWAYVFSGLRFLNAFALGISLLIIYNLLFSHIPFNTLFSHDFFMISANILGVCSAYISEKQLRWLFLREQQIDFERRLQHDRALHDRLTGLPNRELLLDRIEQAINFSDRNDQICAGLFLDLDNFKPVNDKHGHQVGDAVLQELALRFKEVVRDSDTLSRLGGDEFFVLAKNIQSSDAALVLAEKLQQQLELPLYATSGLQDVNLSVTIGIVLFPYKDSTPVDIIRRADQAMYEAKRQNKSSIVVFES